MSTDLLTQHIVFVKRGPATIPIEVNQFEYELGTYELSNGNSRLLKAVSKFELALMLIAAFVIVTGCAGLYEHVLKAF